MYVVYLHGLCMFLHILYPKKYHTVALGFAIWVASMMTAGCVITTTFYNDAIPTYLTEMGSLQPGVSGGGGGGGSR